MILEPQRVVLLALGRPKIAYASSCLQTWLGCCSSSLAASRDALASGLHRRTATRWSAVRAATATPLLLCSEKSEARRDGYCRSPPRQMAGPHARDGRRAVRDD